MQRTIPLHFKFFFILIILILLFSTVTKPSSNITLIFTSLVIIGILTITTLSNILTSLLSIIHLTLSVPIYELTEGSDVVSIALMVALALLAQAKAHLIPSFSILRLCYQSNNVCSRN